MIMKVSPEIRTMMATFVVIFFAYSAQGQLCEGDLRYIWSVMSNQNEHYIREIPVDRVKADGIPSEIMIREADSGAPGDINLYIGNKRILSNQKEVILTNRTTLPSKFGDIYSITPAKGKKEMYYVIKSKMYSNNYLASDGDGKLTMQRQLQDSFDGFDYSSPAILFFLEIPTTETAAYRTFSFRRPSSYLKAPVPKDQRLLRSLTLCFWVRSSAGTIGTILSYSTREQPEALFVQVNHTRIIVTINGYKRTLAEKKVRDQPGTTRQYCITWSGDLGKLKIYRSGKLTIVIDGVSLGKPILINSGDIYIGEKRIFGWFLPRQLFRGAIYNGQKNIFTWSSPRQLFRGEISDLNIWNRALSSTSIRRISSNCGCGRGTFRAWTDFRKDSGSNAQGIKKSLCRRSITRSRRPDVRVNLQFEI